MTRWRQLGAALGVLLYAGAAPAGALGAPIGVTGPSGTYGWGGGSGRAAAIWRFDGAGAPRRIGPIRGGAGRAYSLVGELAVGAREQLYYVACRTGGEGVLLSPWTGSRGCDVEVASPASAPGRRTRFSSRAWSENTVSAAGPWLAVGRVRRGHDSQVLVLRDGRPTARFSPRGIGLDARGLAVQVRVSEGGIVWILWNDRRGGAGCAEPADAPAATLVRLDATTSRARVVTRNACAAGNASLTLVGLGGDRPLLTMGSLGTGGGPALLELAGDGTPARATTLPPLTVLSGDARGQQPPWGGYAFAPPTADGIVRVTQWFLTDPSTGRGRPAVEPELASTLVPIEQASPGVRASIRALTGH